jgi:glycosyltransferase involved in cell wall biosynthesis
MNYKITDPLKARVLIVYRSCAKPGQPYSHAGLGVNGVHTCRVLRQHRIEANIAGCCEAPSVAKAIARYNPTHVIIEACWLSTANLDALMHEFPNVHFIVRAHSQVAFLQVEAGAVKLFREQLSLADGRLNLTMAGNNPRFCDWARRAYNCACLLLPNLYDARREFTKVRNRSGIPNPIRIGSFGAIRLLKNHATAAAASISVGRRLGIPVEFNLSVNRTEHGLGVLDMIRHLFAGLPAAKLVEVSWRSWADFRQYIASMDITMQPSVTETFNIVTADSLAEGVPAIVSPAIEWVPPHWQANPDDPEAIARAAISILSDHDAGAEGIAALAKYSAASIAQWMTVLGSV